MMDAPAPALGIRISLLSRVTHYADAVATPQACRCLLDRPKGQAEEKWMLIYNDMSAQSRVTADFEEISPRPMPADLVQLLAIRNATASPSAIDAVQNHASNFFK